MNVEDGADEGVVKAGEGLDQLLVGLSPRGITDKVCRTRFSLVLG